MVVTPQDLLRRLDARLQDRQPCAGRRYAAALRDLVVAVRDAAFVDPSRPRAVTAFLVDRFLEAEAARTQHRPDDVPLPWRTALSVDPSSTPPLRQLLVTASAGINDDLPHALLALPGWDGTGPRADHQTWTALMADAFAEAAAGSGSGAVDRALALRERPLLRQTLLVAGAQAWRNAEDLLVHRESAGQDAFATRSRLLSELTTGTFGELLSRGRLVAPRWRTVFVVQLGLA